MRVAEFYFDYLSPYAYLASLRVEELCERFGIAIRIEPVLFAGLLKHWGQLGPAEIPPKAAHALRDCLRYAQLHDIPLRAPRYHPFRSLVPLRLTLAAPPDARAQVMRILFAHGWAHGRDLGDADALVDALEQAGLPGRRWHEAAQSDALKRTLRERTEVAISHGVFGIPTLRLDDQLFWGLDQLSAVELVLAGRDPLSGVDLQPLAPAGRSAWRKEAPRPARASAQITYEARVAPFPAVIMAELERLLASCFPDASGEQLGAALDAHPDAMLVSASVGERMVGFKLGYARSPGEFYSWIGGVHPEFRRMGIGRELLRGQHARCADEGYTQVATEALGDNASMLQLDLSEGFRIVGTRLDARGLKVLLSRALSCARLD